MVRGTRRDLAAYFVRKQVGLWFTSLALRLADERWPVVHVAPLRRSCEDQVEDERVDAMGCVGPCSALTLLFLMY
jgi:hypothetical protein